LICAWESDGQPKADLGIRLGFPLMFLKLTAMTPSNINVTANLYILYHTFRFLSSLLPPSGILLRWDLAIQQKRLEEAEVDLLIGLNSRQKL
jgi:hypothetical protein